MENLNENVNYYLDERVKEINDEKAKSENIEKYEKISQRIQEINSEMKRLEQEKEMHLKDLENLIDFEKMQKVPVTIECVRKPDYDPFVVVDTVDAYILGSEKKIASINYETDQISYADGTQDKIPSEIESFDDQGNIAEHFLNNPEVAKKYLK